MKKRLLFLLVLVSMFILTGCGEEEKVKNSIIIGKRTTIKQLEEVPIEGTDDTFMITEKGDFNKFFELGFDSPTYTEGTYIPYVITVKGVEYEGKFYLDDDLVASDNNPRYTIRILNIDSNYLTDITIDKKM